MVKGNEKLVNGWVNTSKEVPTDFCKTATTLITPSGSQYLKEITQLQKGMSSYLIFICIRSIVNPIPFKKEESKEIADLQVLQKKKQSRQIYEKIKFKQQ